MSSAVSGSNGIAHNTNPTGAQAPSVSGSAAAGLSRGEAINPPTGNRPLFQPAIFSQTRAARAADPRYRKEPR